MTTRAWRFAMTSAAVGAGICLAWWLLYYVIGGSVSGVRDFIFNIPHIDRLLLCVWPSSILLMADPTDSNLALLLFASACNVVLYGLMGRLLWAGLYRRRWLLVPFVVLTAGLWLFVFLH